MARVLLTGGAGFVGSQLAPVLEDSGWEVRAAVRTAVAPLPPGVERAVVGDLACLPDLGAVLGGVDAIVHLAARVHLMRETSGDPEAEFHRANVEATRHLAEQAAAAGVKRLVFLSSIKVNGESTAGRPFTEADPPTPQDAYARSKLAAEAALWEVAENSGLEVVVIRPPLVYGPGVKANFLRLMRLIAKGIPLPFGSVDNRRSLVGVWNLCDLIACCLRHPAAAGETFLVSDGRDVSSAELARLLALGMGRPVHLFPIPVGLLLSAARMIGRESLVERLFGSLQVDPSKATRLLNWRPRVPLDEGLRRTARWLVGAEGPSERR